MKLRIDGREYAAVDHSNASLLHLMEMKTQTQKLGLGPNGRGLGMAALQGIGAASAAAQAAGEVPEDADLWMAVMVYLTRRAAGEDVSFLDAIDVPLGSIEVIPEPSDEVAQESSDPTPPPGPDSSAAVDPAPAPAG